MEHNNMEEIINEIMKIEKCDAVVVSPSDDNLWEMTPVWKKSNGTYIEKEEEK